MHICFLTNEYPKKGFPHGGIGSFVKTIGLELVKRGIDVTVLGINYTNDEEILEEDGVNVFRLKTKSVKGLTWLLNSISIRNKLKEIHKHKPISVVEASELGFAFISKIDQVKYVIRLHGGHHFFSESEKRSVDCWKGFQEKKSFKKADAFIAVSRFVKIHTEKYLCYNNKKITLINYPINCELFKPIQTKIIEKSIVFAGTVCEKKGIRQLIQAFKIVKIDFPDATLEIYGRDWFFENGDSYIDMLKSIELPKLGVFASDIHFHGTVPYFELPEKYAQAEVCVFPSHMETQGLVAPEAMAMQKMVVFTEYGPGPETIVNLKTGLLCNPLDYIDIAKKISWVFSNKEESSKIGLNARQFVLEKYSLEKIVNMNITFYKSLF